MKLKTIKRITLAAAVAIAGTVVCNVPEPIGPEEILLPIALVQLQQSQINFVRSCDRGLFRSYCDNQFRALNGQDDFDCGGIVTQTRCGTQNDTALGFCTTPVTNGFFYERVFYASGLFPYSLTQAMSECTGLGGTFSATYVP